MNTDIKVCKIGGGPSANASRMLQVVEVVLFDEERRIIVVSASGKVKSDEPDYSGPMDDEKDTDFLIELGEYYISTGNINEVTARKLKNKLEAIANGLGLENQIVELHLTGTEENDNLSGLDERIKKYDGNREKYLDQLKAWGEFTTANLYAAHLKKKKGADVIVIDPTEIFVLSDKFGDAVILDESDGLIRERFDQVDDNTIVFVPGFYGRTKKGDIATLPRGGSDTTGGRLAGALGAKVYENWTDVDFITRANLKNAKDLLPIEFMTYDEALELSYMGFSVLKDEAIVPCMASNVPINVRNTFNPDCAGTRILRSRQPDEHEVTGIAYRTGFGSINIRKTLLKKDAEHGDLSAYVLHTEMGVSLDEFPIEHIATGVSNISFLIPGEKFTDEMVHAVSRHLVDYFKLHEGDVWPEYNLSLVSLVGQEMKDKPGMNFRAAGAIASRGLSTSFITQGASQLSIIYGINETDEKGTNAQKAVQALYDEFFVDKRFKKVLEEHMEK